MGETKALFPREAPKSVLGNSLRSPPGDLRAKIGERTGLHASMAIWPQAAVIPKSDSDLADRCPGRHVATELNSFMLSK